MFKRISVVISVLGILLAVNLVFRQRRPLPQSPPLSEPASAPYATSIGARGIVESVEENVRITPALAGLVSAVPVKVGDSVRAGAVLFEQDARDAEAQVEVQDANVAAIRSSIAESEVNFADRQSQWNRMEVLGKNRVVSLDEKERTLFAFRAASTRLDARKSDLAAAEALRHRALVMRELLMVRAPRDGTVLQ
ncbi:MAG: biotin/lipoyl-binding protein, partial [Verrucomicrobiota bacterium]